VPLHPANVSAVPSAGLEAEDQTFLLECVVLARSRTHEEV
jgi:hypothetical protein